MHLYACAVRIVYYENSGLVGICKDSEGNSAENIPVYSKFHKIINDNRNRVKKVYLNLSYYKVLSKSVHCRLTPSLVFPCFTKLCSNIYRNLFETFHYPIRHRGCFHHCAFIIRDISQLHRLGVKFDWLRAEPQ